MMARSTDEDAAVVRHPPSRAESPVVQPGPDRCAPDPGTGRRRVVVEHVHPEIDGGRFPIKRTVGEDVRVTVNVFADGHDLLAGVLMHRRVRAGPDGQAQEPWIDVPLSPIGNDEWTASFTVPELGIHEYTVEAWVDRFATWRRDLILKADAGQDVERELLEGAELVDAAVRRGRRPRHHGPRTGPDELEEPDLSGDLQRLLAVADVLRGPAPTAARIAAALDPELLALMQAWPDRSTAARYDRVLRVTVDPVRARFGAWYEMFPRSCTPDPSRGGTFREAEARLADIAAMGFDVLYLPPIHPIGRTCRKGRNNALIAGPDDPGSPWAIGAEAGGHTAVDPGLGTLDDFDRFVATANRLGLEVALDIAFHASPDHPWVREHPEWFRRRPDGTIKHAENPPKQYQDIYPFDFDTPAWPALWQALADVFRFWIAHGVRIFRVDNPHTKPFRFWEWCLATLKRDHPDAIFLSEAFTRPKVMRYLAKAGFTQSYTYFTWRNTADELREYLVELTATEVREYLRPNFFVNTPDILPVYLQHGGKPAFEVRLILAATLGASYGIYSGFELCENVPVRPGSEEYLDSEKYQVKPRDWSRPGNLKELIARVNDIRRRHPALQRNDTLRFHATGNPALLWYSKTSGADRVFVAANTDPHAMQHGFVEMPIRELGLADHAAYVVEDLLDGARYEWRGAWNYVKLDPSERMAHLFVVRGL